MKPPTAAVRQSICHAGQCYPGVTILPFFCAVSFHFLTGHVVCGCGRRSARLSSRHCMEVRDRRYVTQLARHGWVVR